MVLVSVGVATPLRTTVVEVLVEVVVEVVAEEVVALPTVWRAPVVVAAVVDLVVEGLATA